MSVTIYFVSESQITRALIVLAGEAANERNYVMVIVLLSSFEGRETLGIFHSLFL
jgi:hypothetical protein